MASLRDVPNGDYFVSIGRPRAACQVTADGRVLSRNTEPGTSLRTRLLLGEPVRVENGHPERIAIVCKADSVFGGVLTSLPVLTTHSLGMFLELWRGLTQIVLGPSAACLLLVVLILSSITKATGFRSVATWQGMAAPFFLSVTALVYSISLAHLTRSFLQPDAASALHAFSRSLFAFAVFLLFCSYGRISRLLLSLYALQLIGLLAVWVWYPGIILFYYKASFLIFCAGLAYCARMLWSLPASPRMAIIRSIALCWAILQPIDWILAFPLEWENLLPALLTVFCFCLIGAEYFEMGRLSFLLAEQSRRLEEAEKLRRIGELAAQVAHDIQSPLVALSAATSDMVGSTQAQRALIGRAVGRISQIAESLLDERRIAVRDVSQDRLRDTGDEPVGVIVAGMIYEKRVQFRERKDLVLEFTKGEGIEGAVVSAPRLELERALSNLINNAIEASKDGGIVTVSASKSDGQVVLSIADTGCGMPEALVHRLRSEGISRNKAKGNGLGLSHARRLAENAGGSLAIASEVGKGTIVTLKLPSIAIRELDAVLIDDDVLVRESWVYSARQFGKQVKVYCSADEFRSASGDIDRRTPIYVDYRLGTASGLDAARAVTELGFRQAFLATGDLELQEPAPEWLAGVVGKAPPWVG